MSATQVCQVSARLGVGFGDLGVTEFWGTFRDVREVDEIGCQNEQ